MSVVGVGFCMKDDVRMYILCVELVFYIQTGELQKTTLLSQKVVKRWGRVGEEGEEGDREKGWREGWVG